ncbi:FecR family protein [Dyadobacter koreensis]|uniref:FecR family protein n=1 Tax=Dyadobacter koreensis TaxID=408657 RepID=A0A1H6ZB06_9BACT|nr:FecR family protein [Dyadobacter koreensis]SEJ49906.1 FecR family protein [Dyadobacter koreensis]
MKHDPYSLTELIRNDDFIAWVRQPDEMNEARWRQFLQQHPKKKQTVESARRYIIFMGEDTGKAQPTSEQSEKMWKAVEKHLRGELVEEQEENEEDTEPEPGNVISGWRWVRIAASAALIAGMASFSYWYYTNQPGHSDQFSLYANERSIEKLIEKNNDTDKPMLVLLPDGSSVVLQPESSLSYVNTINAKTREVTLKGRAFFEIVKNPEKPFLVYTFGLATKVLGTSFLIDAPENGRDIKVEVTTGKVSVFSLDDSQTSENRINSTELKGFIINPTEKITFSREDGKLTKTVVGVDEKKQENDISSQSFMFDETPVSEVFLALEKAYNIRIFYNREQMGSCPLNATLVGQPIYEKLSVICNALDAEFEIKDNLVTITGQGCK